MKEKDVLMRAEYGKEDGKKCKRCCNLVKIHASGKGRDKEYIKCIAYGTGNGEQTNWNLKYHACKLYNQNFQDLNETPLFEKLKMSKVH